MNNIDIPNLTKLNSNNDNMFNIANVIDFFIKNNSLVYRLNNSGDTAKIKCIKNYNNKYKLFGYKTFGVMSETIYFLLDTENQILYKSKDELDRLKTWIEYLLTGGNYEKVLKYNKSMDNGFDPFAI